MEVNIANPITRKVATSLAFFDTGSQVLLITDKLAKAFDLSGPPVGTMNIAGFNGNISCVPFRDCSIGILNTDGDIGKIKRDILTPTEIIRKLRAPSLIIGNDLFWTFVTRRLDRFIEGYQLISSSVGPLLSGFIPTANSLTTNLCAHIIVSISDKKVNKQIHDWLALQTIGIKEDPYANEDDAAWTRFKDTYKIEDGRYAVSVPIRDPDAEITSNKGLAIQQLLQLKRHEWLKEEIIEKVPHKELDNTNYGFCSYVPFSHDYKGNTQRYEIPYCTQRKCTKKKYTITE
uniref:Peptidase A2 domain-containing protein n=1 Tax=Heterorhabditis bacteriophora TaxID=37862 RepID=A0A1I7WAH8_HETBA